MSLNWHLDGDPLPVNGTTITGATFEYRVGGNYEESDLVPPRAGDDYQDVFPGTEVRVEVLANDTSHLAMEVTAVGTAEFGAIRISDDKTALIYEPNSGQIQPEDISYTVTNTAGLSATASLLTRPFSVDNVGAVVSGCLWQEIFTGITGEEIADLTNDPKFQAYQADQFGPVSSVAASNVPTSSGQRLTGFVIPPTSGNYRFYLTGSDHARVYLSPTTEDFRKEVIADTEALPRADQVWSLGVQSEWIPLVAGERYYIEVLHKVGDVAGDVAVAWREEGDSELVDLVSPPIGSAFLEYQIGGYYLDLGTVDLVAVDDNVVLLCSASATLDLLANDHSTTAYNSVTLLSSPQYCRMIEENLGVFRFEQIGSGATDETIGYRVTNTGGQVDEGSILIRYPDLDQGLVAHYRMDHVIDGQIPDVSGGGRHLDVVGDADFVVDGFQGQALDVNQGAAGAGYLLGNLTEPLVFDQEISVAFWASGDADKLPAKACVIEGAGSTRVFAIHLPWQTDDIYWDVGNDGTGWDRVATPMGDVKYYENGWHHWVFTKDAATGIARIFIDGSLWFQADGADRVFTMEVTKLTIGTHRNLSNLWSGKLDDMRIYDRALGTGDVRDLFAHVQLDLADEWLENYNGGASLNADANGDGVSNLVDFAVGNDPLAPDLAAYPKAQFSGDDHTFRFRRRKGGSELSDNRYLFDRLLYQVEVSDSLLSGEWYDDPGYFEEVLRVDHPDTDTETIYLRPSGGMEAAEDLFFRLKLQNP